jgi:ATP-dependent Zn protease
MSDPTESYRRKRIAEINVQPGSREALELQYGQVWTTEEMSRDFEAIGFSAPFIVVRRRVDGKKGSLEFQHRPRFYFNFSPHE